MQCLSASPAALQCLQLGMQKACCHDLLAATSSPGGNLKWGEAAARDNEQSAAPWAQFLRFALDHGLSLH